MGWLCSGPGLCSGSGLWDNSAARHRGDTHAARVSVCRFLPAQPARFLCTASPPPARREPGPPPAPTSSSLVIKPSKHRIHELPGPPALPAGLGAPADAPEAENKAQKSQDWQLPAPRLRLGCVWVPRQRPKGGDLVLLRKTPTLWPLSSSLAVEGTAAFRDGTLALNFKPP